MEEEEGPNHHADNAWDIAGTWELQCRSMATNFGQTSPYTLQIFSEMRLAGKQTYGRFDLGEFKGVFRFSTLRKPEGYYPYQISRNDVDEFILDADDEPPEEDPTRCYRWRGKAMGENIFQLRSDNHL